MSYKTMDEIEADTMAELSGCGRHHLRCCAGEVESLRARLKIAEEFIEWQKCACHEGYQCKKHEVLAAIRKEGEG